MHIIFIFLFLSIPLSAKEPSVDISASGLGFLSPALEGEYFLYRSFEDTMPFDTLSFRQNEDGTLSFVTKTLRLKPYRLYEGDSKERKNRNIRTGGVHIPPALAFRALQKGKSDHLMVWDAEHQENVYAPDKFYSRFLLVINEETGETAVIKTSYTSTLPKGFPLFGRNQEALYETWEQYLLRALGVSAKDNEVVIYDGPHAGARSAGPGGNIIFQHNGYLPYQVFAMDGDYIKVKKAFGQKGWFEGLKNTEGWMRWRENNNLLINITEYGIRAVLCSN